VRPSARALELVRSDAERRFMAAVGGARGLAGANFGRSKDLGVYHGLPPTQLRRRKRRSPPEKGLALPPLVISI
jgi:hypothetical protein